MVELKHEPDTFVAEFRLLLLGERKKILAVERHGAFGRAIQGSEDLQQGALAGSGGAHDRDQFPAFDVQVDVIQHDEFPPAHRKRFVEIDDVNHVGAAICNGSRSIVLPGLSYSYRKAAAGSSLAAWSDG